MDKELIAMCDCPEIQDCWKPTVGDVIGISDKQSGVVSKNTLILENRDVNIGSASFNKRWPDAVFLPSVSWLLREIEVGKHQIVQVDKDETPQFCASFLDESKYDIVYSARAIQFGSPPCNSPEVALLHVLMWQKGKIWKDNEWRVK